MFIPSRENMDNSIQSDYQTGSTSDDDNDNSSTENSPQGTAPINSRSRGALPLIIHLHSPSNVPFNCPAKIGLFPVAPWQWHLLLRHRTWPLINLPVNAITPPSLPHWHTFPTNGTRVGGWICNLNYQSIWRSSCWMGDKPEVSMRCG